MCVTDLGSQPFSTPAGLLPIPLNVTNMKIYLDKTLKSRFAISCVGGVELH